MALRLIEIVLPEDAVGLLEELLKEHSSKLLTRTRLYEKDKAKQAMRVALIIWSLLLIVLIVIIYWSQGR